VSITVLMSGPTGGPASVLLSPRAAWTFVGAAAIPLWATWPLLAVLSSGTMPLFQFLAIIFGAGAMTLLGLRRFAGPDSKGRGTKTVKWLPAFMVALGLLVSDIFFIEALRFIPAAQANLILYLWPVMVVLLGALLGLLTLLGRHLASVVIGLLGAALVIGPTTGEASWQGISLAAAGGLAWAAFCVFRLWQGPDAPEALTSGFFLSAAVSLLLHLGIEKTTIPSAPSLLSAVLVGVVPLALGNLAWDCGIRRGDRVLLAVFAYATPLMGALLLMLFGFAEATIGLLLGGVLIVAAGIISAR
jgi:drug/metabolite transporter (DMT)-like permease